MGVISFTDVKITIVKNYLFLCLNVFDESHVQLYSLSSYK